MPALSRRGANDRLNVVLGDNRVAGLGQAGGVQEPADVAQPDPVAIATELAGAVAEDPPADGHLDVLDREAAILVVEDQAHLRHPHRRPVGTAGEDHLV